MVFDKIQNSFMKKLVFIFLLTFSTVVIAQIQNPIKWSTSVEKISDKEYDLIITADIEQDWHLYSQYTADGGSLPIFISKKEDEKNFELLGKAKESDTVKKYNDIFEVYETFFEHKAVLKQRILLQNDNVTHANINLTGQVCKEVCLQIDEDFSFALTSNGDSEATTASAPTKPD